MRPSAHWGTFTRKARLGELLLSVGQILKERGFEIFDLADDGDFLVIGGNDDVLVQVVCVPLGGGSNWVAVIANSTDNDVAARERSAIREEIQNIVFFD